MALRNMPIHLLKEGDKPTLIPKGEYPGVDTFFREIINLPEDTPLYHISTSKILPPIEFIGGRETRSIGDTCRMFLKVKQEGMVADYYFWDGLVPQNIRELGEPDCKYDTYTGFQTSYDFGLVTGRTNPRIVLVEKIKKAPRKREALDDYDWDFTFNLN
jgi:hypothetical protein